MKARSVVQTQLYRDAVEALEEFKGHLAKGTGMVVYGEADVKRALEMGAVKLLLIHEDREDLEEWKEMAENYSGAKVVVIPNSLPESEWFKNTFGGLAGILRYRISR